MPVGPIKQAGTTGAPALAEMKDGQLFIDEAAQVIWTAGLDEPVGFPLGGQGLPPPARYEEDYDKIVVQGASGLTYGVLLAGAGGQPQAIDQWSVPGLTAHLVEAQAYASAHVFVIEINEPLSIHAMRLEGTGGGAVVVADLQDNTVATADLSPGVDAVVDTDELALGRYVVTFVPTAPCDLSTIVGSLPGRAEQSCPIFFMLSEVPDAG